LGRVLASNYHEIVVDLLGGGTTYLRTALRPLITAAAQILDLDQAKRAHDCARRCGGRQCR
jgi:hypothetical protein